jgi:L,D-transpeptidase YnhG
LACGQLRLYADERPGHQSAVRTGAGGHAQIINEPVKFSVEPDGKRYIEVHRPLAQVEGENPQVSPITHSADFATFVSQGK